MPRNFWNAERDQILRDRYERDGPTVLAQVLGVPYCEYVRARAKKLGLKFGALGQRKAKDRWRFSMRDLLK